MSRGKKRLGSGGKANPSSLSAVVIGPVCSRVPSISISTICAAGSVPSRWVELVGGDHVHGLGDEELAGLGLRQDLGEQLAHLVHLGEPAEHGDELPVLALGDLEIDDVVVEVVFAVPGRDRLQLGPGVCTRTVFRWPISEVTSTGIRETIGVGAGGGWV